MKLLSAAVLLTAALPFAAANAQGSGWGGCTPALGDAVGMAGPAMNGGQLAAGVGQCRRISDEYGNRSFDWGGSYADTPAYAPQPFAGNDGYSGDDGYK